MKIYDSYAAYRDRNMTPAQLLLRAIVISFVSAVLMVIGALLLSCATNTEDSYDNLLRKVCGDLTPVQAVYGYSAQHPIVYCQDNEGNVVLKTLPIHTK